MAPRADLRADIVLDLTDLSLMFVAVDNSDDNFDVIILRLYFEGMSIVTKLVPPVWDLKLDNVLISSFVVSIMIL
jgi:hypothetical protein